MLTERANFASQLSSGVDQAVSAKPPYPNVALLHPQSLQQIHRGLGLRCEHNVPGVTHIFPPFGRGVKTTCCEITEDSENILERSLGLSFFTRVKFDIGIYYTQFIAEGRVL